MAIIESLTYKTYDTQGSQLVKNAIGKAQTCCWSLLIALIIISNIELLQTTPYLRTKWTRYCVFNQNVQHLNRYN